MICAHCALAFKASADLAMVTTKLALRDAGFNVSHQIATDWENLRATRLLAFKAAMAKTLSTENT